MNITVKREVPPQVFNPVTLTVTLSSQAEVDALYAVGNWNAQLAATLVQNETANGHSHSPALTTRGVSEVLVKFFSSLDGFQSNRKRVSL